MSRAFLCHSSDDKDYVRIVARRLGRGRVLFDEYAFEPGEDFRHAILRNLDRTQLFVFFVSAKSLASSWCRFELDQAELRRMNGGIEGQLALLLDTSVSFRDLPAWLSGCRAIVQPRPSQASRDVENALLGLMTPETRRPFVGRQDLSRQFSSDLVTRHDTRPRIVVMSGLEGVGRRSYLRRVSQDALDLPVGPEFLLTEHSGLEDLYLAVEDELRIPGSRHDIGESLGAFQALDEDARAEELAGQLRVVAAARTLPAIVDSGGALLDRDTGAYRQDWVKVFERFLAVDEELYLAIVQRQAPRLREVPLGDRFLVQRVPPLTDLDSKVLLGQLFRRTGQVYTADALDELAEYLGGYPPAAYFASAQVAAYGMSTLLADRAALVDFRAKRFTRFLDELQLEPHEWHLLSYLANESAVPFAALCVALDEPEARVADALRKLIDLSVIVLVDDNYAVSPPISDAVVRMRGFLQPAWYASFLQRLEQTLWAPEDMAPSLAVIDLTLRASLRAGREGHAFEDLVRVSAIHDIATESYHRRDYEEAVAFAQRAVSIYAGRGDRARLFDTQEILVKALARLERYDKAEEVLRELKAGGARRYWYLRGFLLRKQRDFAAAADALDSALALGDQSNSVYRDYADVLLRLGDTDRARRMIDVVLNRDRDNVFILDLVARIEIEAGNRAAAHRALSDLERTDVDERFIFHRRATFHLKDKDFTEALKDAERAVRAESRRSPFEAQAVLADVLIECGQFERFADLMGELDRRFKGTRHDVRDGLRCKALTRQGKWQEALVLWDGLREKDRPVHKGLLVAIMELKAGDYGVSLPARNEARELAAALRDEIGEFQGFFVDEDEIHDIASPDDAASAAPTGAS